MENNKLDFWIKNNMNVMFSGYHGIGKTERIKEAFNRNNLNWIYFSASTLDPWTDFCGVPKEVTNKDGLTYLDFVRPKWFVDENVQAIFLDEYNRAPAKVINATMELIQFKSINGKKLKNLRFIWVAINPDDKIGDSSVEYTVQTLDPAHKDRFQIHVHMPYKPDLTYFINKYGEDIGKASVSWWNDLSEKDSFLVSPRRLDYAIDLHMKSGDIRDVIPRSVNVAKLISELKNGSFKDRMEAIFNNKDEVAANKFINDDNSYTNTIRYITEDPKKLDFFFKYIPEEKRSNLIGTNEDVQIYVFDNMEIYETLIKTVSISSEKVKKKFEKYLKNRPLKVSDFKKYTYSGVRISNLKIDMADTKPLDLEGHASYIDLINHEISEVGDKTVYRRNIYNKIISYLGINKGYFSKNSTYQALTVDEVAATLDVFNKILSATIKIKDLPHIAEIYGFLSKEYISKYGKTQDYEKLDNRVHVFLNTNAELFL